MELPYLIPLPNKIKPIHSWKPGALYHKKEMGDEFVDHHRGPTGTSNWLIRDRLLMSAYPGDTDEKKAIEKARCILESGIRTIVCLQTNKELMRFKEYRSVFESEFNLGQNKSSSLQFLQLEIPDTHVAQDTEVNSFVDNELIPRFHRGEKMLIHCWGGHGRTGTICAIVLGRLYQLSAEESLKRVAMVHGCRDESRSQAPQTTPQFEQVRRLIDKTSQSS